MNPVLMNAVPLWIAIPAAVLLVISGLLALCGAAGLLRFSHFYPRVHAPTLGNTMGIGCVLFCIVLIVSWLERTLVIHVLVISLLLILVSPVTAILLMKAALRRDARKVIENAMPSEMLGEDADAACAVHPRSVTLDAKTARAHDDGRR